MSKKTWRSFDRNKPKKNTCMIPPKNSMAPSCRAHRRDQHRWWSSYTGSTPTWALGNTGSICHWRQPSLLLQESRSTQWKILRSTVFFFNSGTLKDCLLRFESIHLDVHLAYSKIFNLRYRSLASSQGWCSCSSRPNCTPGEKVARGTLETWCTWLSRVEVHLKSCFPRNKVQMLKKTSETSTGWLAKIFRSCKSCKKWAVVSKKMARKIEHFSQGSGRKLGKGGYKRWWGHSHHPVESIFSPPQRLIELMTMPKLPP